MTELPIILDDLIEEELQNEIEDAMFDCFWTYSNDNSLGSKILNKKYREFLSPLDFDISPSFCADMKHQLNNNTYKKIIPVIKKGCNEIKFNIEKIQRCVGGIHALIRNKSKKDNIHTNLNIPHLVMLYYVNNCDGDTILYDKTLEDVPFEIDYPDEYFDLNITRTISPKKGRILLFDGGTYHSASSPTTGMRCIINLDLFGEFVDGSYKFPAPKTGTKKHNILYQ